jgi:serine/threonine-protein kinase RsbW
MMADHEQDTLRLDLPCCAKYLQAARLAVTGAASRAGLTIEEIEDLTVAVGEACNNAIDHAFDEDAVKSGRARIRITVIIGDQEVRVEVEDQGRGFDPKRLAPRNDVPIPASRGLGLYIMRQFVDELDVLSSPGSGTKICLLKRSSR